MSTTDGKDPKRYTRLPTAPVPVGMESGPQLDGGLEPEDLELDRDGAAVVHEEWHPTDGTEAPVRSSAEPRLAPWAAIRRRSGSRAGCPVRRIWRSTATTSPSPG